MSFYRRLFFDIEFQFPKGGFSYAVPEYEMINIEILKTFVKEKLLEVNAGFIGILINNKLYNYDEFTAYIKNNLSDLLERELKKKIIIITYQLFHPSELVSWIENNSDIINISKTKPVATLYSGWWIYIFLNNYNSYNEKEKEEIIYSLNKLLTLKNGYETKIKIFENENTSMCSNRLIFYEERFLTVLLEIFNYNITDFLLLVSNNFNEKPENIMNMIYIAFGDKYKEEHRQFTDDFETLNDLYLNNINNL